MTVVTCTIIFKLKRILRENINAILPWKDLLNPLKLPFKNAKYLIYEEEKKIRRNNIYIDIYLERYMILSRM